MHPRRLLALVLVVGAGLLAAASPARATSPPERAPTLFVLRGSASGGGDQLTVETRRVEWFTDRPARRAGKMTPRALVRGWKGWGFADDPPNAALTGDDIDVVVELSEPRVRAGRLRFDMKPVRGNLPKGDLGEVSAFVDATSSSSTSTVEIVNNSGQQATAYVFVTAPNMENTEVQSTAWLTQLALPGAPATLTWDTSTQLMWGELGAPVPGTVFAADQLLPVSPAGPGQSGTADLAEENGDPSLTSDPTSAAPPGTLAVQTGPSVPTNVFGIALGISGSAALVAPAEPNETTTFPATGLTYWLSTAPYMQTGSIIPQFSTQNAVQLTFPPGVSTLTATLEPDGTWTIEPA